MGLKQSIFINFIFLGVLALLITCHVSAEINLQTYCKDGYYQIPGEAQCSRAPNCGGKNYDEVLNLPMPNPQECMGDGEAGRAGKGCAGYVPLCCYEVQRTHDPRMCVGYWERLWCTASQCANLDPDKAAACGGGSCQCAHAFKTYCGNKPPIPLETRLGLQTQPTSTPTPTVRATPTSRPTPTSVPTIFPTNSQTPTKANTPTPQDVPFYFQTKPTITEDQTSGAGSGFSFASLSFSKIFPNLLTGENKLKVKIMIANSAKTFDMFGSIFSSIIKIDNNLERTINHAVGIGD